ncbi:MULTISPECIES: carbohydrate ABC transporter permease [Lachnospiraceae]|jgi:raffinose/stachyose/melibiose transport system permease protein|uniref:Sugar ABC transporter permease n=1 Tax=Faecalicatena acetigenes TaxID=2981790 RepID=A0ABT2TCK2_9FIRM|nr:MULTISPECIES: sugar ABC transporter permease [Lachnospiraceae]MCU6747459.1 sugar ABC transporter permease [Faecalicatena acetigenes]SCH90718.1 sn-glycerol-3-phosphate transport system permease protein ugpA [uncultured Clostridium sp.]
MKIKKRWYVLFTAPLMLMFFIIMIVPFITGIGYSFVSWDGLAKSEKIFVGLSNYTKLFSDTQFLASIVRTTVFTLVTVLIVNILALAFALLVTTKLKVRNVARTMLFLPYLIGGLILGYIWQYVLGEAMTSLSEMTGMENIFFNWLVDKEFAFYAMIVVATWQMAGYMMIVYIAGLESISDDVIEAAQTDGAGFWQTLLHVKLPLLMSSVTICLFLTLSNCFKIYDVNVSLTGGGPNNSTEMVSMNIFNEIFTKSNFGYGQAKAVLFFVIVAIITLIQVKVTKDKEVTL